MGQGLGLAQGSLVLGDTNASATSASQRGEMGKGVVGPRVLTGGEKEETRLPLCPVALHARPRAGLGPPHFPAAAFPPVHLQLPGLCRLPCLPPFPRGSFPLCYFCLCGLSLQALGAGDAGTAGEKAFPSAPPGPLLGAGRGRTAAVCQGRDGGSAARASVQGGAGDAKVDGMPGARW